MWTAQSKPPQLADKPVVMRSLATSCLLVCIVAVAATGLSAQSTPAAAIVSIRPSDAASRCVTTGPPPVDPNSGGTCPTAADRFDWPEVTLVMLIRDAYGLFDSQVIGGPDWVHSRLWDVSVKATVLAPDEARQLVRRLVEDRFALKAHTEMRELPIYNLVLGRTDGTLGPKIKRSAVDCTPFLNGTRPMQESPRDADHSFGLCSEGGSFTPSGLLTPRLNGQPLTGLIRYLQETLERPVIDQTGLKGNYDIELSYLDESLAGKSTTVRGPTLFAALEQQLGLKLESARGPAKVLVIDSVSEPTTN